MAVTTNKAQSSHDSGLALRQPKVINQPVVAQDEDPQEEAKAASNPVIPSDRPLSATGDEDSIAHWNDRKGAPPKE